VNNPSRKLLKRSSEKPWRKSLEQPGWPERPTREKGTTFGNMTRGHPMMRLEMALLHGDTTQSLTNNT
jgi:hypothetical protein